MTILHLISDGYGGYGGIARYNQDFQRAALESGAARRIICLPRVVTGAIEKLPLGLEYFRGARYGYWPYLTSCIRVARRERRVGLILCGHLNLLPVAALLKQAMLCPLWLQIYGLEAWWRPRFPKGAGISMVDHILSISEFTRTSFLRWQGPLACTTQVIAPTYAPRFDMNGPRQPSRLLRDRYGLDSSKVMLSVSRISKTEKGKGVARVIALMPELLRRVPDLKYLVVGTGNGLDDLLAMAHAKGVGDKVVFAGRVSEEELGDHYHLADAFVLPSTSEGFGIVFLEAAAHGLPIVAGNRDASPEVLCDGKLGVAVDPDDQRALVDAIERALERGKSTPPPELRKFSWERFRQQVFDALVLVNNAASRTAS
jgi:phosphatidyl-myo-inositol dimannoside synthase